MRKSELALHPILVDAARIIGISPGLLPALATQLQQIRPNRDREDCTPSRNSPILSSGARIFVGLSARPSFIAKLQPTT
jgi:hypothetical protein